VGAIDLGRLTAIRHGLDDIARGVRSESYRAAIKAELSVVPRALLETVPWLVKSKGDRDESLLKVAIENARVDPFGLALEMGDDRYTWGILDEKTSQIAHVLSSHGVGAGDVVALIGQNSPLYAAIIQGVTRLGGTTALVNNHLEGHPLSHAVKASGARVALVDMHSVEALRARPDLKEQLHTVLTFGPGDFEEKLAAAPTRPFPRVPMKASDDYVYIYTSGTTGLPKPCKVSHGRALVAGASFGPLFFGFQPGDKLYNVLPLYHSNALLLGTGGCIMTRTPMALRSTFSAKAFWDDVQRYRATAMIYIGELCRYLLNTPESPAEKNNPLRVALGNGMRADVWEPFQTRFGIEQIREFYGATEAPGIIVNLSGKTGAVGRVPARRLSKMKIVRYDVDTDEYVRDSAGFCIECNPGEVGELLIKLLDSPRSAASEFRGYTDAAASDKKIVRDVFERGDRFYRSGDLMRYDEEDFFYFVDRIGDTYRWKGENVSTAEVADVLSQTPGVRETTVLGVQVPGMEGQAGLAALVLENGMFDAKSFWRVAQELPSYAQPRFVRILDGFDTTATFKIQKVALRKEGIDPVSQAGNLYVRQDQGYAPLTPEIWSEIAAGGGRL
jgi:fatty-acyl-CoA synthase